MSYVGKHVRRWNGVVHRVVWYSGPTYTGSTSLRLACGKHAKWHERGYGQNKIVDSPVTCFGCIAGTDTSDPG